jgi:nucleotide-binding universal stress UspA family protein
MEYILLPVESLDSARAALDYVVSRKTFERSLIHLLNVQRPILIGEITHCRSESMISRARQIMGREVLRPIQALLDAEGIDHTSSVITGEPADAIALYVANRGFTSIVMTTRGMSAMGNLLFGSVAAKVIHITDVPVTLIKRPGKFDVPTLRQGMRLETIAGAMQQNRSLDLTSRR